VAATLDFYAGEMIDEARRIDGLSHRPTSIKKRRGEKMKEEEVERGGR